MEQQNLPFPVFLSFIIFMIFVMVFRIRKKQHDQDSNRPPGPWKFPILGNLPHLLLSSDLTHQRFQALSLTCGPVMSLQLGQVPAIIISSAEAAKQVMKIHAESFAERPMVLDAQIVLYNRNDILFGSYGDHWRQMRKIWILEFLSAKRVQSSRLIREEELSDAVTFLRSGGGSPVNLSKVIFEFTNSILIRTAVGKNCKQKERLLSIADAVNETATSFGIADAFPSWKLVHYICGVKSKPESLHKETDQILEEIIGEHKSKEHLEADNLLDVLLNLHKDGNLQVQLTNESIKASILQMFTVGSETTSKVTEWAMAELMKNPNKMRKAQEEVRQVFGDLGKVDESRFQDLKFLKLIVKETLRLHPPGALIPRECRQRTRIDGYDIDPKTRIIVNAWAIGRDPKTWIDARKFNPERFQDCAIDYKGTTFELIPFGAGKRICPGMTLGITNLELFLANLLYHFDWELADGIIPQTLDMSEAVGGAVRKKTDLKLIPIPYQVCI
ncbi:cytochrome P450 family 71 subfamily B polypeptide 2 [Euphorbia peplus]|nr:putative cytochrome P450 monooxygenase [Euphorbia peplus]WCJ37121.1 cytochrome P450 family 71 subfamily B polypeptide 2 [Euphorbia peplus]